MIARTGRPRAATLLAVSVFGMALVLVVTGGALTQLARCCDRQGAPASAAYVLTAAMLAVGLGVVALRLWRGEMSPRAALVSEVLIPVVFVGAEIWALRELGWQTSAPVVVAVVVVVAWWVLAWRARRGPSGEVWMRSESPDIGP